MCLIFSSAFTLDLFIHQRMRKSLLKKYHISMEKRILPRAEIIQTLKDKFFLKYPCPLHTYLKMSESMFKEKYVLPYKDELLLSRKSLGIYAAQDFLSEWWI